MVLYNIFPELQKNKLQMMQDLQDSIQEYLNRVIIHPDNGESKPDLGNYYYEREVLISRQGKNAISLARSSIYWEWTRDVNCKGVLNLLLDPSGVDISYEKRQNLSAHQISIEPKIFCDGWIDLSKKLIRYLYDTIPIIDQVVKQRVNQIGLSDLLDYLPDPDNSPSSHLLIIGNDLGGQLTEWANKNALDITGTSQIPSEFLHRVIWMEIKQNIAVNTIRRIQIVRQAPVRTYQQIFPHEQTAVEIEGDIRTQMEDFSVQSKMGKKTHILTHSTTNPFLLISPA